MKYNTYIIFIIIFFLTSCKFKKEADSIPEIHLNPETAISKNFSEIVDTCFIVKLPIEPLLGEIQTIKIIDRKIFLCDYYRNMLHIYNIDGSYINTLHKYGRGPEEYMTISSFAYDKYNNKVIINDRENFYHYILPDFKFAGKSSEKIYKKYYINFEVLDREHWLMISDNDMGSNKEEGIFVLDNIKNEIFHRYDINNDILSVEASQVPVISTHGNKFYYAHPHEYSTIYELSLSEAIPLYRINFGEKKLKESYWQMSDINRVEEKLSTEAYAFLAQYVVNTDINLNFWYIYPKPSFKSLQLASYNKRENKLLEIKEIKIKGIEQSILPNSIYDDYYVSLIIPESLDIKENQITTKIGQTILDEVRSMNINDVAHPLLLFYRLK